MNPAFLVLLLIGVVGIWFILAFLFRPIGKLLYNLWSDAKEEINKIESEDNK